MSAAVWGTRLQLFRPKAIEITSAGVSARSNAEVVSPRGGAGVAEVADVETELPTGDGGPGHGRSRRQPTLGDGVAVGEPPGLERRRDHRLLDPRHPGDERCHPFGEIDGDGEIGPARHDELGHPLTHDGVVAWRPSGRPGRPRKLQPADSPR